jgi:hypothetical protein
MHKNIKYLLGFYVIVAVYSFLLFYSSFAYLKGFYDPFYPTSCVPPEKILQSQSEVFIHAKTYYIYYPLSLIFNSIFSRIININCLDIGILPILPLVELIFYHAILLRFTRSYSEKITLLCLYSFALISILDKDQPPFYITLGNITYFLFIFLLLILSERNTNSFTTSDFVSLFLFALVGTLSYYTSGFSITASVLLILVLYVFANSTKKVKSNKYQFIVLTITMTYLSLDYMFYRHLEDIYTLNTIEKLFYLFSKKSLNPQAYSFTIPLWVSIIQRIYFYLSIILDTAYILILFLKIFKRNVHFSQIVLGSALMSSFVLSLYYSVLVSTIYLRNYIFFFTILIPLVFPFTKRRFLRSIVYLVTASIVISGFITSMYYASNSDTLLSRYTSYVRINEYKNLCAFLENTKEQRLFADLKTSFTLPILCNNPNVLSITFRTDFFSYYNESFNMLKPVENGFYLYASSYMKNGIYLLGWNYYKPFIVQENDFNGTLLNSGSIKLYMK